uniref:Uncharacterized protein n=1 Tax=viral metagenome TaxID=1070528 RepID=A0A6C0I7P1_9ZZZZ
MCYTQEISLSIATIGFIYALYLMKRNIYASIGVAYFSFMELLQFIQFYYINQCNNYYNKLLTQIGYLHICFQPLFINIWLSAFTNKINYTYIYMSIAAGILLASRLFYVNDDMICDINNEPLCGINTCTYMGNKHLAWNIRLRAAGSYWFTPSIGLHFFMFVIPVLVAFKSKPIIAILLTGPFIAMYISNNIEEEKNEIPTIWCLTITIQMIITYYLLK